MTDASAVLTADDFTTTSSTAAKAQAAIVPTAYSAVVIPASAADRTAVIRCLIRHFTRLSSLDGFGRIGLISVQRAGEGATTRSSSSWGARGREEGACGRRHTHRWVDRS